MVTTRRPLSLAVLIVALLPAAVWASTGPLTPTHVLSWGGNGTSPGLFATPNHVAVDVLGDVYVVDQFNHRIQKFDRVGRLIAQWGGLGSGNGQFNYPSGVAVDGTGNVYVADNSNHRVQKFTALGAYLAQWGTFGTADGQLNSPSDVATDVAGNVYVSDQFNHRIQKFTGSGAFVTRWGSSGTSDGQFAYPAGVTVDGSGNVYVADTFNQRIQKFTSAGVFVAKWGSSGSGPGLFNYPLAVAADALGRVYVADQSNHRIQKFTGAGAYVTAWGSNGSGPGQFNLCTGVAVDAAGNVYAVDQGNHRVQKFSGAGVTESGASPARFLLTWGTPGPFISPLGIALDAAGNVYVTDASINRVQKFSATGVLLTMWGTSGTGNGEFYAPIGIAIDAAGFVYVVDSANDRIQKFTANGSYVGQWGVPGTGNGEFDSPHGVLVDAAGDVYVADADNHRIQKFTSSGAYITQWGSYGTGNGQFHTPTGMTIDPAGYVYVVEVGGNRVQKFTSAGAYVTQWGSYGTGIGQFALPVWLAADASGSIYVSDQTNNRIQKFTATGTYLTQWGSFGFTGNGYFNSAQGIAVDPSGNVYVVDLGGRRVQKFVVPAEIAMVSDVRNDQGRQTQIRFLRSSADAPGAGVTIPGYEIYRRNDPLPAADEARVAAARTPSPSGAQLAGWTWLTTVPAHGESEYNVVVPTLVDATESSLEYTAYMVRAATTDPFVFFDSSPGDGYSIDNLPPPTPTPFTAAASGGDTHLHWGENTAQDFATFRLYRGSSAAFVPGPGNLVVATSDTGYVDTGNAGDWYKLSAVDLNGNESAFALITPTLTTDVPDTGPLALALEGSRPNPALDGQLRMHFTLPDDTPATIELFDLAGRRIAGQVVGALGAGRHSVDITGGRRVPAGVYLVRLSQGVRQRTARAVVLP